MQTVRILRLLAAAGFACSLAGRAADNDRPPPAPPEPAKERPPAAAPPSSADHSDYSREQERAVKPPTDASMGAVERKLEPGQEPVKKK